MKLRKLHDKDVPLMLEWMHDDTVVHYLRADFASKKKNDCIRFIAEAQDETKNIHLAIVNDYDEYMGTVSLKNIQQPFAELGIVLRAGMIGGSYASAALKEIFEYGYNNRGIEIVYWCVDPGNKRAVRFYEKQGFQRCDAPDQAYGYTTEEKQKYIWYWVKINERSI